MSKMSRRAQAFQQEMFPEMYKSEKKKGKDHEVERRITALEKSLNGNTTYERSNVRRDAVALAAYLRRNGYPKQPDPTQSDDVEF